LLGYVILSVLLLIGLPLIGNFDDIYTQLNKNAIIKKEEISVSYISKDSPAIDAGLKLNDKILDYGNSTADLNKINDLSNFEYFVRNNKGREIYLLTESKGKQKVVNVIPRTEYGENDGPIGIGLSPAVYYSYPFGHNFIEAFKVIQRTFKMFFATIGNVFSSIFNLKSETHDVAGPVGIAVITSNVAKMGMPYLIAFLASFSINLAIVNLLPIPGLDGGRILMLIIEKISGRKFSQKFENYSVGIGLTFLLIIVVFVTIKDILFYFIY
jgi:regulator of sigma E protease